MLIPEVRLEVNFWDFIEWSWIDAINNTMNYALLNF